MNQRQREMSLIPFILDLADDLEQLELDNTRISIGHWPAEFAIQPARVPQLVQPYSPQRRHRNHHQNSSHRNSHVKLTKSDGFQVSMEVEEFEADEIIVKIINHSVIVEGRHEEKEDQHGFIARHFVRRYEVPDICDIRDVVSTLTSDKVLTVRVPYKMKTDPEVLQRMIELQKAEQESKHLRNKAIREEKGASWH